MGLAKSLERSKNEDFNTGLVFDKYDTKAQFKTVSGIV